MSAKRIPVIIPDEHYEYLRNLAHNKRTSMSEEVRNAIRDYVANGLKTEKNNSKNE